MNKNVLCKIIFIIEEKTAPFCARELDEAAAALSEEGLEEIRQGLRRMGRNLDENRDVCEASAESCGIVSDPDENRHEADASAGSGSIMQGPGETRDEAGASAESIKEEERNSRWEQ